ncbi:MAG: PhnD/SsuA/transferrin family substrate-binding protein [Hoeflea sp.]|uniref:phosphate/phosphite/phosphonate ABC transporter substrate-binding protein n=1 Tax=Hoeflea sp. TaxID=1940281 RepID=UPI0032ECD886
MNVTRIFNTATGWMTALAASISVLARMLLTGLPLIMGGGVAAADYRETVSVLRIGMIENHAAAADPLKLEAVRQAFSDALGISVEIIRMSSYAALVDAHASGRIGYAIHSARSYAATDAACGCVEPLRVPVAADGSTGFRSVLAVRDEITGQIGELRIAYSTEESVSGWLIPQRAMRAGSLDQPQLVRAGDVISALKLFEDMQVDGFFGWIPDIPDSTGLDPAQLFGGWASRSAGIGGTTRVIWSSQPIPYGPHATHRSLPDDLVEVLGEFLDRMPQAAPGLLDIFEPVFAGGYAVPDPGDYENLRDLVVAGPADTSG